MCKKVLYLRLKSVRPASRPQPLFVISPHVPQQTTTSLSSARHLMGQLMPFRSAHYTERGRGRAMVGRLIYLLEQGFDSSLASPNFVHISAISYLIKFNSALFSLLLFIFDLFTGRQCGDQLGFCLMNISLPPHNKPPMIVP